MAWARVDDQWWSHPKVLGCSLAARGLWVTTLSWSCAQRKPAVPESLVRMVAGQDGPELAAELTDVGLWDPIDDGWVIHDWPEYQDLSLSEKRRQAGRKGAEKRWQDHGKPDDDEPHVTSQPQGNPPEPENGKPMANEKRPDGKPIANAMAGSHPIPTHPDPSQEVLLPSVVEPSSVPTQRQRDPFVDVAAAAFDLPAEGQDGRLMGMIAARARKDGHGPDEIVRRVATHLATFSWPATPGSVHKRWNQLGSKVVTATASQRKQMAVELDRMRRNERIAQVMGDDG